MAHALLRRLHNPHGYECSCDPDCWCRRTALGRAVRWWFPGRYFGLPHKNGAVEPRTRGAVGAVRVVGYEPCFHVADVARAVAHYELLGFTISFHDDSYAFAHRDRLTIHLAESGEASPGPSTLYLHVDDAERLAADWRAAGFEVSGPDDTDYGKREGSVRDPDGNLLRFGSPLRR